MDASLVVVEGVTRVHGHPQDDTYVRALDGIDLRIARGEYLAITGESGSGKTSLLHLLCALDRPTSGTILLEGLSLQKADSRARARLRALHIGVVFQGANLIEGLDALGNVMLAARYAGTPLAAARERAVDVLRQVGLGDRLAHRPYQLSGGQQQRVAIARALMNRPSLLLADEPTGELDSKNAEIVLDIFDALHRDAGQTIVVITHNSTVWQRAQRVVRLADGKVAEEEMN